MALLGKNGGLQWTHVPYKGGGPLMQDVVAGHVPLSVASIFVTKPHIESKRLRPLAVTTSKRSSELPDVPTVAESGYPGFDAPAWWGVLTSAKVPPEIVGRMNAEINKALKVPEIAAKLAGQGMTVVGGPPDTARTFIDKQIDTWSHVVKDNNIKAE
jgi:tripartite-type tricarboxylate transporter receptor subunit TctC